MHGQAAWTRTLGGSLGSSKSVIHGSYGLKLSGEEKHDAFALHRIIVVQRDW
jgi:hypothetical protein